MKMIKRSKHLLSICIVNVIFIIFLNGCNPLIWEGVTPPTPESTHIGQTICLKKIWSKSNIYMVEDGYNPLITASSGKVCFLGDIKNVKIERKLICLNSLTGDILWERSMQNTASAISSVAKSVYVAYSGGSPGVRKYDIETGKIDWSQDFHGTGTLYLYTYENQIQLQVVPDKFIILDAANGDIIQTSSIDSNSETLIINPSITFLKTGYELYSIDTITNISKWSVTVDSILNMQPLFLNDKVILRTGRILGSASAINFETGKEVWKTKDNIIGNPVYSSKTNKVYVLSREGDLLGIDKDSGKQNIMTIFTPNPLILYGEKEVGGYELAFDETSGTLFVLLGDSRQLFAFQEQ